jgi:hypothetical protein
MTSQRLITGGLAFISGLSQVRGSFRPLSFTLIRVFTLRTLRSFESKYDQSNAICPQTITFFSWISRNLKQSAAHHNRKQLLHMHQASQEESESHSHIQELKCTSSNNLTALRGATQMLASSIFDVRGI